MKESHVLSLLRVCICLLSLIAFSLAAQGQAQAGVSLTNPSHDWQILHGTLSIQMKAQGAPPGEYTVSAYIGDEQEEQNDQVAAGGFTTDGNGNWGPGEVATWNTTNRSDATVWFCVNYIRLGVDPWPTTIGPFKVTIANTYPAWEPPDINGNGIQCSGITAPSDYSIYPSLTSSFEIGCTCAEATDSDHRYAPSGNPHDTYSSDTLTYYWTCSGGLSWKNGVNTGRNVTLVCPANYYGNVVVTCTVYDAHNTSGENGSRDDDRVFYLHLTVFKVSITDCDAEWLPEGGETQGNTVSFTAWTTPTVTTDIKFTLSSVSTEPGYCLNAGSQTDSDYDLKFIAGDNSGFTIGDGGLTATKYGVTWAVVTVRCYDYGAYGLIKAESVGTYAGAISGTTKIPKDTNSNDIADAWDGDNGAATDDNETDPVGDSNHPGDGFSRYEEYRGFGRLGSYERGDPQKKDIYLRDVDDLGWGYFGVLGLNQNKINASEWDHWTTRVVNFNHESHHAMDQHAVWTVDGGWDSQVYGTCLDKLPDAPEVTIYCDTLENDFPDQYQAALDKTVAHELGHAVNLYDHAYPPTCSCVMDDPICVNPVQHTFCQTHTQGWFLR